MTVGKGYSIEADIEKEAYRRGRVDMGNEAISWLINDCPRGICKNCGPIIEAIRLLALRAGGEN